MKNFLQTLLAAVLLFSSLYVTAQPATVSYPFAVGRNNNCGSSGTHELHYYTYNGSTNTIANASGGLVNSGVPQLRIGASNGPANGTNTNGAINSASQRFTSSYSSVSYNPQDHNIYFFWTATAGTLAPGGIPRTYAWRWPVGTTPTSTTPRLDTIRSFPADILGVAFDNNGNGFIIEFTGALPTVPPTYKPLLRSINFATGVLGAADTLALTGGAKIYQQGSGDVAMSPSGQMFFVVDNKLFTPSYQSYTGTGANLTCTYIDTVKTTNNFVGLTYAEGETIAAYSGGTCPFEEIALLTAANNPITKSPAAFSAADMATVISGIGAAKRLVSYTNTGVNQYDVVYDILIKNYGNTDVTNVQVVDSLRSINGVGNFTLQSVAFVGTPPAGIALNPLYNGAATVLPNANLLTGTGTLPNYPTSSNSFTIRVTVRLNNIVTGTVYKNSAIAKGVGFNSVALRDSSTNGNNPDLNSNDKPDNVGEGQPTPFLISVVSQTDPCTSLSRVLYSQTFGTGTTLTTTIPVATLPVGKLGAGNSGYTGTTTAPVATDRYTISNNPANADAPHWLSMNDHTGNTNGRMLLVNADASGTVFYRDTVSPVCPNQQYSFFFYAAFVGNASYQTLCNGFGGFKYPKLQMQIRDVATGAIITSATTGDITSTTWNQYGLKFIMPTGFSNIIFEIINIGEGGCGNDIAFDDIQFGTCDALPTVTFSTVTSGCLGGNSTFTATVNDASAISGTIVYQWQISTDSLSWSNVAALPVGTNSTYVLTSTTAADVNKYYRVIIAASGNMGSASCQYVSPGYRLTAKTASNITGASIAQSRTAICSGDPVRLTVSGGTLGTNAVWRWYTGSCGGTPIGTGTNIVVNPTAATTYYVRMEGDCNTTTCVQITLTMNCDIDDDDDGIPDIVEGNGVDPSGDDDADGILNFRDTDFPGGFTDVNGDGVNDRFDADLDGVPNHLDLDSDNDGIPDVVESGGVDANGDGRIDNYTDTDGDGFSQNVDGNNTGAAGSGNGLGAVDTDGDGIPNYLDLDSDNDGIPDVVEVYGTDANNDGMIDGFTDTDGDGFSQNVDGDQNNDGTIDNAAGTLLRTGPDANNDGRADSYPNKNMDADGRANPYDLDSDGDGITDVREAGFADTDWNGKIDGTVNAKGRVVVIVSTMPNSDASGRVDVYDIDSDNDGIPDNVEGQTTSGYYLPTYIDADNDGIDDRYDNAIGTFGGDGIHPPDSDGDGIRDYVDIDTDNDGLNDIYEGNDLNFNGHIDDGVALSGSDTDGDGLDNFFDTDNASAKGTSRYMGNGGSATGDLSPGSRTVVQRTVLTAGGCGTERDWRCLPYVLSCNMTTFKAIQQAMSVQLDWSTICRQEVDHFIVQRSFDKITFTDVATVAGKSGVNDVQAYKATDDISAVTEDVIYYRIKTITQDGKTSIGNVISVRINKVSIGVQIAPNPVKDVLKVFVNVGAPCKAELNIMDVNGKVLFKSTENLKINNNVISYNQAASLPNGVYYMRISINDKIVTQKFSVLK